MAIRKDIMSIHCDECGAVAGHGHNLGHKAGCSKDPLNKSPFNSGKSDADKLSLRMRIWFDGLNGLWQEDILKQLGFPIEKRVDVVMDGKMSPEVEAKLTEYFQREIINL
jgi:hypothetical protein